nr:hypothetical protein [New Jersey aster yellows phytoplasma]
MKDASWRDHCTMGCSLFFLALICGSIIGYFLYSFFNQKKLEEKNKHLITN